MASKTSNRKRKAVRLGDQSVVRGEGGEIHQNAGGDVPQLTTQQGIPASDDQNTLKVGSRGPAALEDFHFREKIFHFDHERIPERVVAVSARTATSKITGRWPASRELISFIELAREFRPSFGSPRWPATKARLILPAMCAASQ